MANTINAATIENRLPLSYVIDNENVRSKYNARFMFVKVDQPTIITKTVKVITAMSK